MKKIDGLARVHLQREITNYLADFPTRIQHGTATIEDLGLSLGKLLTWVAGTIDSPSLEDYAALIGVPHDTCARLGEEFKAASLAAMAAQPKRPRTKHTLESLAARLERMERSARHE